MIMTNINSVRETLDNLEEQLMKDISAHHAALTPLESELAKIRRAKASLGYSAPNNTFQAGNVGRSTIKQLVLKALTQHFKSGATAVQIREFIRDGWGRDVTRASLSPQLSRLLIEGLVTRDGHIWNRK